MQADSGAFQNLAGSAWPGISDTTTWNFSTGGSSSFPFADDFSTDKGWTGYAPDYWERGSATAGGAILYGNPDPGTDHSATADNQVVGINLGGDYATTVNGAHYLTSPVIDCSGQAAVKLSFWRLTS